MRWTRLPRRGLAIAIGVLVAVLVGGYAVVANVAFETMYADTGLMKIDRDWCHSEASFREATPAEFHSGTQDTGPFVDTAPYLMPDYDAISFPSREPSVTIAGWWVAGAAPDSPAVIVVHGRGKCRWDPEVLIPAGMLHRAGFGVLLIDLRNHGDSTVTDGHQWFGLREYPDVLGAWDWLHEAQLLSDSQIGVLGVSLGGATSLIAFGQEPRLRAIWEDSAFASVDELLDFGLAHRHQPSVIGPGLLAVARFRYGVDLSSLSAVRAMASINGRAVMIVHGADDDYVPPSQAKALADAVRAAGGTVEPWIVPGATHVRSAFVDTAQYDRRLVAFFASALGPPSD